MIEAEKFERLKKDYIKKTMRHLEEIEKLSIDDLKSVTVKAELALRNSESVLSFSKLSLFIFRNSKSS